MPAAMPYEIRRQIVERHQAGETLVSISHDLGISYDTVRKIWQHWRRHGKLTPNYEQARQKGTRKYQAVYDEAVEMKRAHPKWGAQIILLELQQRYPDMDLPSVRTLQTWFKHAGVNRPRRLQKCRIRHVFRGMTVHEVWAVDAKEQIRLADGSYACWLTITDEASGAILGCETFPPTLLDANLSDDGQDEFTEDV